MSVKRAVRSGRSQSRRDVSWMSSLPLWLLAACSFQTQPLFEPSRTDPSTAVADAASTDAAMWVDAAMSTRPGDTDASDAGSPTGPIGADAASGPACLAGQVTSCSAGRALTCRTDGSGFESIACGPAGCNAAANGCNACLPGQRACGSDGLMTCGADGRMQAMQACPAGCAADAMSGASCRICQPGAGMCRGKELARCAPDGLSWQMQPCAQGCDAASNACTGSHLVPVNLPHDACTMTGLADRDVTSDLTIDTDEGCARVIPQSAGQPEICLHAYAQLRVREGVAVRAQGSRALALLATRSMRIEGRISVSARGSQSGPGSALGPLGDGQPGVGHLVDGMPPAPGSQMVVDWPVLPANGGGGGGGHATPGAPGGDAPAMGMCGPKQSCAMGGAGGAAHGSEQLAPLEGGSHGGSNSASEDSSRLNDPGGGGGAIQLVACEELILGAKAVLDANGGGGDGGGAGSEENVANDTPGAGAGGGSGGAILIQARMLTASPGGIVVANGGGGGGGASRANGMRVMLQDGMRGQDGLLSSMPAPGGAPAGQSQPGGVGGALMPAMPGASPKMRTQAAGGGGGAAGRIRIEIGAGDAILQGVVLSPPPSRGSVLFE